MLETIVDDVIATQSMSTNAWWAQNSNAPFVSMAIPAGQSREYRVTQAGVDAAHALTEQSWQRREDLRQTVDRTAFDRASFTAIGEAIATCKAHLPEDEHEDPEGTLFYAAVETDYVANLNQRTSALRIDADRHIPCHLFDHDQGVGPFEVGPVVLRSRDQWVTAYVTDPGILAIVRDVEQGRVTVDRLRARALAPNSARDDFEAWEVIDFLRHFGWVASIHMPAHESGRSHQKASILIGLAIDTLGLRFHAEDARAFTKADRAHLSGEVRLATTPSGRILRGARSNRAGLGSAPGRLAAKVAAERPFLDAAGTILQSYVDGRQTGKAPHIVERWANALYWVGEARREASDFMAVVNYGCALDGLTGAGGEIRPMTAFAEAALNPGNTPTPADVVSVGDAVRRVYAEGRNKLAHGEMPGLLEDLADVRRLGDDLLTKLFDPVTFDLADVIANSPAKLDIPEKHFVKGQIGRLAARR